ncbi:beta-N-acetylhexosaminidase [Sphaerisporangium siamense]|uniref:beta-N-acetylhexosaminidase n=1 Tax=Sphaerisporangium siamense TaxID=795645 RepID=A0A7W7DAH7_9ACTN|nr:family 20 glycosylhydrolase [Sphaerisporangium siamense]MBB4703245.1 hexosaminidase [Sphaerisporangium siamense]GII88023.1 beta-N-acetylhexosaminidase [Sphaerisporangium siamense]
MSLSLPSRSSQPGAARRLRDATRRATARLTAVLTLAAGAGLVAVTAASPATAASIGRIVPAPVSAQPSATAYTLPSDARVQTQAGSAQAAGVGAYLAGILRRSTGYALPVTPARGAPSSGISLLLTGAPDTAGEQGYQLDVTAKAVVIRARTPNGLFNGVQTLRQLLPAEIESATARPGPWVIPGGRVVDHPRFTYRGAMLDVARHFHPVETVKQYIDRIALYKINYLHLHLTDDQGWRIAVDGWPRLATYGGSTQVGGGPGGYYTKADYKEIVAYAAQRFVTIVPEVDIPGHTNAALASYAELNCDGVAPPLYTGIRVGFSSLCTSKEDTYTFVKDVLTELAAITPGPYLHIGGDEAHSTPAADYATFMNRVQPMVAAAGKSAMGWHQMGAPTVGDAPGRVLQYWGTTASDATVSGAVARGAKVVMSPANKAYLDMKYDATTPLGLSWAGYVEVKTAYDWNPGAYLAGVPESSVLGVEAPLWTETLLTEDHIEYMAFPRLPAIAELGWSPWSTHDWEGFRARLGAQAPRWTVMGIDFYRSSQVVWSPGTVTHEAEDATVSKGAVRSDHPGYSGSGYVDYPGGKGAYVQWDVAAAEAGWATLRVRYANGGRGDRPLTIEVNGRVVARRLAFPPTGSWSSWRTRTVTVDLPAGTSTVRATAAGHDGGPNVDLLEARF